jgi:hypothetical protein
MTTLQANFPADKAQYKTIMKLICYLLITGILIELFSCKSPTEKSAGNKVFYIDIDNPKTFIDLKLSDLADSFRLVPLETTRQSILGPSYFYAGNDYIIAFNTQGVYKFSADGVFIKKIINVGRGPREISGFLAYNISEKNNLLFIDNMIQHNPYFIVYDIESEKFLDPVKKCIPDFWGSFALYNDSVIVGTYSPMFRKDSIQYAVFYQNFKGELLYGIPNNKKYLNGPNSNGLYQKVWMTKGEGNIHIKFQYDDTLFTLKNNVLSPYLIPRISRPGDYLPNGKIKAGDRSVSFPAFESSSYLIFSESVTTKVTKLTETASDIESRKNYFFLNKSIGDFAKIKSFTDDLTGRIQLCDGSKIAFPEILPNGKFYVAYNPSDLKKPGANQNNKNGLPPDLFKQLEKVSKNLDDMDNPVLLIGTIKKEAKNRD